MLQQALYLHYHDLTLAVFYFESLICCLTPGSHNYTTTGQVSNPYYLVSMAPVKAWDIFGSK